MIRKGWDVNIHAAEERNVLLCAAYYGNLKLIATLIKKYGFKPTVKDKSGYDILYYAQQGKKQESIDFCTDTTHLNQLYHDYLTSFIIPVIPLEAGASVVIDIMAPMERQAILERQIEQCLKERLVILQALIQFCDSPANENDAVARDILNKLLGERNLTLKKIEENLDSLLAEKEIQGKRHYYPLLLCRLETVKYTGNLPTASENILYLQAQLALEKQNNPTPQDSYHKFQFSYKTLQDLHQKLQFSYNKLELSLGEILLIDALKRSYQHTNEIASIAVIVDAINDNAIKFYEKYGVISVLSNRSKLYLPMESIGRLLVL